MSYLLNVCVSLQYGRAVERMSRNTFCNILVVLARKYRRWYCTNNSDLSYSGVFLTFGVRSHSQSRLC